MAIPRVLDLDTSRMTTVTDTITIPADGKARLSYIPKKQSIQPLLELVAGQPQPSTVVVSDILPPSPTIAYIDWKADFNYLTAEGVLAFHTSNAGKTFVITYIPAASRVESSVINQIVDFVNSWAGKTGTDLTGGTIGIPYSCLLEPPGIATTSKAGLLGAIDKTKLDWVESNKPPVGGIVASGVTLAPTAWSGTLEFIGADNGIVFDIFQGKVRATINRGTLGLLTIDQQAALVGTSGTPNDSNKFVTNGDSRLSNARTPTAHPHAISQVVDLQTTLNGKAATTHPHVMADITDLVLLPGEKGDKGDPGVQGPRGTDGASTYPVIAALPAADETQRGKIYILDGGVGVADTVYVCLKQADETYAWILK